MQGGREGLRLRDEVQPKIVDLLKSKISTALVHAVEEGAHSASLFQKRGPSPRSWKGRRHGLLGQSSINNLTYRSFLRFQLTFTIPII